ncbi:MAG: ribosomal protein S18-alanine N-acetyltransferase [Lachnospiraceae bacterium]|nr:ribosomal protein S18-alanine N-acetyltransferase [Lachnospiraceae bacterium]
MTIREMNFDDIAEIAEIEKLYSETPWDANGLLTYLLRDDTIFLVADSLDFVPAEGEAPEDYYDTPHLLGYAGLLMVPYEADILNITVRPEARRQGIATKLLGKIGELAEPRGVTVIHLEVRESNTPARTLYGKLGFTVDGIRKNYYERPRENAVLMTLDKR